MGMIANPAASKDIRRLVAQGRVVPDWEKVNTLKRALLGLQAVGVDRVVAMPDSSHLVARARDDANLSLELESLDMPALYTEGDTVRAAQMMEEMGVGCVITLGGDGTNRAVAKGSASIPIVAVSTGTNNVFPTMIEGTLAGLAAGLVVQGDLDLSRVTVVSKMLEIYIDGQYQDMALVDVALSRERFVATRAIWDMSTIYEVFLTRAEPSSIGLSSIGGRLQPLSLEEEGGLYYRLADSVGTVAANRDPDTSIKVLAPIAPGMISTVPVADWRLLEEGERVPVEPRFCTIALDGERSISVTPDHKVEVGITRTGPPVVQVELVLETAATLGLFRT
ncbi:MAG: NAD(+)/NADH kinase [Dehalococcoidia bacterium]|nr:NAD(+)/NADH kinase [Dehalococcoidia bacterium]MEE2927583.1 NAD(+)/NADH kinase [Chloroflexota bacterium]